MAAACVIKSGGGNAMTKLGLHHVAIITTDLDRSAVFYESVLGFTRLQRPPFKTAGIWFAVGALQLHVIEYPIGTFRKEGVNSDDVHFALRTDDFEASLAGLEAKGFSADLPEGHPQKLIVKRTGLAGFPQVFFCDPDRHIIEINQPPL